MKLSEIYPKPNLTIECDDFGMSTIINEIGDIILVYKLKEKSQRRVIWKKENSLTEIFKHELLDIITIKEVIDWNPKSAVILYNRVRDRKQYTIAEICKILNEDLIEIVDEKYE